MSDLPVIFNADDFNEIYNKIFKEGMISLRGGDMWEPYYRPEDIAKVANTIMKKVILSEYSALYLPTTVTLNGDILYRKVLK